MTIAMDVNESASCIAVAVGLWPPFVTGSFPNYTGPVIEMFNYAQKTIGFCYEFVKPQKNIWGTPYANGSWNGLMGMLQRKEAAMSVGPFGVTLARSSVAEFSHYIFATDHTIIYKSPQVEPDLLGFVKPFTALVWISVVASLLLVTIMASTLHQIISQDVSKGTWRPSMTKPPSFIWGFMVLVGQVLLINRRNWGKAEKTIVATWMLTALVLAVVYKGNLKAMLIVPKVSIPFDSIEGMVAQKDIPWTFARGSIVNNFVEASYQDNATSVFGRVFHDKSHYLTHPRQVMGNLKRGFAGIFTRRTSHSYVANDFSKTGDCKFTVLRKGFIPVYYSMGFPKESPLKLEFDNLIAHMSEFGVLQKLLAPTTSNASYCLKSMESQVYNTLRPLATGDFLGVFTLYAVGVTSGIFIFFLEIILRYRERSFT